MEAGKNQGNPKFWGNERADQSAKAAAGGGAASFVEGPCFADVVQVRNRDGRWIRDVYRWAGGSSGARRESSVACGCLDCLPTIILLYYYGY